MVSRGLRGVPYERRVEVLVSGTVLTGVDLYEVCKQIDGSGIHDAPSELVEAVKRLFVNPRRTNWTTSEGQPMELRFTNSVAASLETLGIFKIIAAAIKSKSFRDSKRLDKLIAHDPERYARLADQRCAELEAELVSCEARKGEAESLASYVDRPVQKLRNEIEVLRHFAADLRTRRPQSTRGGKAPVVPRPETLADQLQRLQVYAKAHFVDLKRTETARRLSLAKELQASMRLPARFDVVKAQEEGWGRPFPKTPGSFARRFLAGGYRVTGPYIGKLLRTSSANRD
jgi:hypothetical protein